MEGCRWKWAANGPEQASGADEAMELAAFVDQLQARPGKSPDRLRWGGGVGLRASLSEVSKRRFRFNGVVQPNGGGPMRDSGVRYELARAG